METVSDDATTISQDVVYDNNGQQRFPSVQLPASTDPPSSSNPPRQAVWLIYGASGHMGRSLVRTALAHGDKVCAVGKTGEDSLQDMQAWFATSAAHENYLSQFCDVRLRDTVQLAFETALDHFGEVDVVVNCSGYGVIGACEDQDDSEIRNQFETNFMGTLNIIQAPLAYFREREAGRYLIFSSTSGALGVPGLGPYCASKYAVEGLVESMLYEVDPFNIKMTLVELGHMRRDDRSIATTDNGSNGQTSSRLKQFGHLRILKPSTHYANPDSPALHARRVLQWMGDHQPTSAVKSAELVWQLGHCSFPPLRLLLGSFAVDSIRDRLKSIIEEIEDWKELHFPPIEGMEEADEQNGEDNMDQDE